MRVTKAPPTRTPASCVVFVVVVVLVLVVEPYFEEVAAVRVRVHDARLEQLRERAVDALPHEHHILLRLSLPPTLLLFFFLSRRFGRG